MRQQKVKELRNQKGWSQSDLSSLSGLSVKTIQRIEKCQGSPSLDSAKALASVFETDFAEFLPAAETGVEAPGAVVTATETAASAESADVRAGFLRVTRNYWQPAVIAVFMAATIGFLAQLYVNVESLSADVSDLLTLRNIELAAVSSQDFVSTTSNTQSEDGDFMDYYGGQPLKVAFQAAEITNDAVCVSLSEIVMLLDAVERISTWEEPTDIRAEPSSLVVLKDNLRRYGEAQIPSNSLNQNSTKMHNCVPVGIFSANWGAGTGIDLAQNDADLDSLH